MDGANAVDTNTADTNTDSDALGAPSLRAAVEALLMLADEPMSIMINGREMIVGDLFRPQPGERNRSEHHLVMRFDLGDMTDGGMDGEFHIEIMGDRDMGHLAEVIPHLLMTGMMEDDMWDKERGMDMGDEIGEELMRRMRQHDLPMGMLEELIKEHEIHNEYDVVIGMDLLIDRLKAALAERNLATYGDIHAMRNRLRRFIERQDGGAD
mgnify:CR=1 FL=1